MTLTRLAATLAELVDAQSFHCWMPEDVKEFNYAEFRNALHLFSRKDSWIIYQKGCQRGDGNPSCAIRDCCRNLKVDLCFDCSRFPCERVKGNTGMIREQSSIRDLAETSG